jgi:hypothetical protein
LLVQRGEEGVVQRRVTRRAELTPPRQVIAA